MTFNRALLDFGTDHVVMELSDGKEITAGVLICRLIKDAQRIKLLDIDFFVVGSAANLENLYRCLLGMVTGIKITFGYQDELSNDVNSLVTKIINNSVNYFSGSESISGQDVGSIPRDVENALNEDSRSYEIELATSGTSGVPKTIVLKESDLVYQAREVSKLLGLTRNTKQLFYMPINYVYGLSVITTWLISGGRIVIPQTSLQSPNIFFDEVVQRGITVFSGVPYTYNVIVKWGLHKFEGSALSVLTQAGGRLRLDIKEKIVSTLKSIDFWVMYGQTEFGGRISQYKLDSDSIDEMCVGVPLPGIQVHIEREETSLQLGEVFLSSPSVCKNIDCFVTPKIIDGYSFYPTGDIGKFQKGLLYISDRNKNFIKIGGARISSARIQRYFDKLKGVQDCFLCLSKGRTEKVLIGLHTSQYQKINTQWELSETINKAIGGNTLAVVLDNKPHEIFLLHGELPLLDNGKQWLWKIHETMKEASSEKKSLHIWL